MDGRNDILAEFILDLHIHKEGGFPKKCAKNEKIETNNLRNKLINEWKEKYPEALNQHQNIENQPMEEAPPAPSTPPLPTLPKVLPAKFPEDPEEIAKKAEVDAWIVF